MVGVDNLIEYMETRNASPSPRVEQAAVGKSYRGDEPRAFGVDGGAMLLSFETMEGDDVEDYLLAHPMLGVRVRRIISAEPVEYHHILRTLAGAANPVQVSRTPKLWLYW